ncbi:MAG: hypothetical protein ACKONH_06180 [Planctomycetia bacterium]
MIQDVHYHQPCPVCGRTLRIGVTLLGRRVYCQHCGGGFVAADPALGETADRQAAVLEATVDRLIEQAALVLDQSAR